MWRTLDNTGRMKVFSTGLGATGPTGPTGPSGPAGMLTQVTTITGAALGALNATPVTIVTAPATGFMVYPMLVTFEVSVTTGYTANGNVLSVVYPGQTLNLLNSTVNLSLQTTGTRLYAFLTTTEQNFTGYINTALTVSGTLGQGATGVGSLIITTAYIVGTTH